MNRIFLLGASGHAKMIIEAIRRTEAWELVCCLDSPNLGMDRLLGIEIQAETPDRLRSLAQEGCFGFIALGDNRLRKKLTAGLDQASVCQATIIDPTAVVSPSAVIGPGTIVMPRAVVGASCKIGRGVIINTASHIDHDGVVGDYCHIGPGCHLAGNITINDGAFVGVGASIIPAISIGTWSIVGAGSTVIRNVPANEIWVGNPAKFLKPSQIG